MEDDFMKRGYLLPEGCKDLIDVWKSKGRKPVKPKLAAPATPASLPPITGEMMVPASMTVAELGAELTQTPYQIVADLMELGIFVTVKHQLDFESISKVLRKYGLVARRAA
jgi:hypothetical protein